METNRNNPRFRGRKSQFDRVITELGQPRMINKPVLNATNSGDPQYLRTWIADVSLALRDHGVIRKYLKRRKLFQQVRDSCDTHASTQGVDASLIPPALLPP